MNAELLASAEPLIRLAFAEDHVNEDVTSIAIFENEQVRAEISAKSDGIFCGGPLIAHIFHMIDPSVDVLIRIREGHPIVKGELIGNVIGSVRSVLAGERTMLNFLQRLCGVATTTAAFVSAVSPTKAKILDTRKTAPGFRELDKYAVRCGGGVNHRHSLADMILIKDNHIVAKGSIAEAVRCARAKFPHLPVEVETRNLQEVREALAIQPPVSQIMLDNMTIPIMRQAVRLAAGVVPLEASGGMTLSSVRAVADTGVDFISVGELTHSVQALDIHMKIRYEATSYPIPGHPIQSTLFGQAETIKRQLGSKLVILGHHYIKDECLALADFRGDSLQLAFKAISCREAKYIVWEGVRFMAEMSAILALPDQKVYMVRPDAGCFLADCAPFALLGPAWDRLNEVFDGRADEKVIPVTYVNSDAATKAFVGEHGGVVCTSSNCERVLRWAWQQRQCVLFLPDKNLGYNIAVYRMHVDPSTIFPMSAETTPDEIRRAKMLCWQGCCNVHQRFTADDVRRMRRLFPSARIIVHPECSPEVVGLADDAGSTTHIISETSKLPPGSTAIIGTDARLVDRLAAECAPRGVKVYALSEPMRPDETSGAAVPDIEGILAESTRLGAYCPTMAETTLEGLHDLLALIKEKDDGHPVYEVLTRHEITVPESVRGKARLALERMLALGE